MLMLRVLLLSSCQFALATTEQHVQPAIATSHLELNLAEALENPQEASTPKSTKRRKAMVEEEVIGFKVIKDFCMDGMHCWPVKIFSISILLAHFLLSFGMIYSMSRLYSQGLRSGRFYAGGGILYIVVAIIGLCSGYTISLFSNHRLPKRLVFTGSIMTLSLAFVFVGRRGALLGGFGGICAGMALGTSVHNKIIGCIVGGIVGFPVGIIIGVLPLCWSLDANQRYSNSEEVIGSFEEHGSFMGRRGPKEGDEGKGFWAN